MLPLLLRDLCCSEVLGGRDGENGVVVWDWEMVVGLAGGFDVGVVEEEGVERGVGSLGSARSTREFVLLRWRRLILGIVEVGEDYVEVLDGDGFGV